MSERSLSSTSTTVSQLIRCCYTSNLQQAVAGIGEQFRSDHCRKTTQVPDALGGGVASVRQPLLVCYFQPDLCGRELGIGVDQDEDSKADSNPSLSSSWENVEIQEIMSEKTVMATGTSNRVMTEKEAESSKVPGIKTEGQTGPTKPGSPHDPPGQAQVAYSREKSEGSCARPRKV